jgi:hypothetical protein
MVTQRCFYRAITFGICSERGRIGLEDTVYREHCESLFRSPLSFPAFAFGWGLIPFR